jgi:HK97 family phage portal protein
LPNWNYGKELGQNTNTYQLLDSYKSWVYVCSSLNATSVAQLPLRLYFAKPSKQIKTFYPTKEISDQKKDYLYNNCRIHNIKSVRNASEIVEVLDHPFYDILRNVNGFFNSFDLWELTCLFLELTGNAYWLLLENKSLNIPAEIWIIPSDRISPIPHPEKFISGYMYEYGMTKFEFKESEIVHFRFPNPKDLYRGCSPLSAAFGMHVLDQKMNQYNLNVFDNQGRLSGIFSTEDALDEPDFARLKEELKEVYSGLSNAGTVGLLDNGLKFQETSFSPSDLSYIEGMKTNKETIMNCFGQSISLWSENPNRSNAETAQREYMRRTIRPRCIRMAEKLNEKLLPKWDSNIFCMWDDPSQEDKLIDLKVRTDSIKAGILTINDVRRQIRMPSIPGGDEPLIQSQYIPLSLAMTGAAIKNSQNEEKPKDKPKKDDIKSIVDEIKTQLI